MRFAGMGFQGQRWELFGMEEARNGLSNLALCRLHCFFKSHRHGASSLWQCPADFDLTFVYVYTQGVGMEGGRRFWLRWMRVACARA